MSDSKRIPMRVDGVVHLGRDRRGGRGAMACGLAVYDGSLDAIMKMFVEGAGQDVDCMTCLVVEARGFK